MKALIKVGYGCNENCSFCHTAEVRHIQGSSGEVAAKIRRAARLGHSMVVLSGGEPTIRPELLEWARLSASLGLDFGLVTNGLRLAYPALVDRLVAHRLRYVYLSLHGGERKIHNLMVRTDAFEAACRALENLSGRGLDVTVNCVCTRHNVDHLRDLVDLVLPYPDLKVNFSMIEPKGGGSRLFDHLMPRVSHVAERVMDAIDYGESRATGEGPRFFHGALPLCLTPGREHQYGDLKTHRFRSMIEVGEPDFFPVDDLNKLHPEPCEGCALRGPCPGLYRGYHEVHGHEELRPLRDRPRSNSFNYRFERLITRSAGSQCPLRGDGTTPWDRGRDLFVRNGERIALFRADTRDFGDDEIIALKHDLGQVYVDVSRKDAPDDFARDLVKLGRSGWCGGCPHEAECTGMYEPVHEDVFSRDDARVKAILGGLRGDVLDVGCGEAPYAEVLEPLARSGQIHYLGLEPEAGLVASLRDRHPWAEVEVGAAEDFDPGARRFDHVLILRSWNHLREPARALGRLLGALRPGGSLTIVDNVAFGLARTEAQARRGEGSRAGFEHYRNDDLRAAHRWASAAPDFDLEPLERLEIAPDTSNQWLLRYRVTPRPAARVSDGPNQASIPESTAP